MSVWQHGVNLDVHGSLCCTSLMGVLLALGIMDLGIMTLVGAAIAFERITPWPVSTARVVGLGAPSIGMVVVARALFPGHLVT
jgi:predicted metal-binding membrane protein